MATKFRIYEVDPDGCGSGERIFLGVVTAPALTDEKAKKAIADFWRPFIDTEPNCSSDYIDFLCDECSEFHPVLWDDIEDVEVGV